MISFKQRFTEWYNKRKAKQNQPSDPGQDHSYDMGRRISHTEDEKNNIKPWLVVNPIDKVKAAIERSKNEN